MTEPLKGNIGPKSAAWLRQVGLRTEADLVAVAWCCSCEYAGRASSRA